MLFKTTVLLKNLSVPQAEPELLYPQFEAADEAGAGEKLQAWLYSSNHELVAGTEVVFAPVEAAAGAPVASGPVAPDGTQLPTLEEYVAAGYQAESYGGFLASRMAPPRSAADESPPDAGAELAPPDFLELLKDEDAVAKMKLDDLKFEASSRGVSLEALDSMRSKKEVAAAILALEAPPADGPSPQE